MGGGRKVVAGKRYESIRPERLGKVIQPPPPRRVMVQLAQEALGYASLAILELHLTFRESRRLFFATAVVSLPESQMSKGSVSREKVYK